MHASYQQQDTTWEEAETSDAGNTGNADTEPRRPGALGAVVVGLLALIGGGALAGAPYLNYVTTDDETLTQVEAIQWPDVMFYIGVAGAAALGGLIALMLPRRPFGTVGVGMVVVPAAAVGGFQASQLLLAYRTLDEDFLGSTELGLWLVAGGTALTLLAAFFGLLVAMVRIRAARGMIIPFLGIVASAGLLQWWGIAPLWTGEGGDAVPLFSFLNSGREDAAAAAVTFSALGVIIAAVAMAAARTGAAALGIALGATFAVGLELTGRILGDVDALPDALAAELRMVPTVLTAVTAGVLLLLTIALAISTARQPKPAPVEEDDVAEAWAASEYSSSTGTASAWDQPGTTDSWGSGPAAATTVSAGPDPWSQPDDAVSDWKRDEDAGPSWSTQDDDTTQRAGSHGNQPNWPSS